MNKTNVFVNSGLDCLKDILRYESVNRVFLVTGKSSYDSVSSTIQKILSGYEVGIFNDFEVNPKLSDVIKGVEMYRNFHPDIVIAIGGGSSIDIAKSINILSVQPYVNELNEIDNITLINPAKIPLVALPTTAGTGSEATHFSVLYIDQKKYSLAHESILPKYVVLDAQLVKTMPDYIAACSGFDALSQAVESIWSSNRSIESERYAVIAIEKILPNIVGSVSERKNDSLSEMVEGSYYSGKAINITKTTAPHAISYPLTSNYGVPHGHAVAAILGPTALFTYRLADYRLKNKISEIFSLFGCASDEDFYQYWSALMSKCRLASRLNGFGVTKESIDAVVRGVDSERLSGHPVDLSPDNIRQIVGFIL